MNGCGLWLAGFLSLYFPGVNFKLQIYKAFWGRFSVSSLHLYILYKLLSVNGNCHVLLPG